ncbi:dienelactone hydrolase family protein [Pseudoalteromonas mariniglutinosa]|uniref:dienelactone hydrolase family protein n=1 Tax=Pseudoalteromonas mariniglutinosa TaxID=206042 RepID=UPI00384B42BC
MRVILVTDIFGVTDAIVSLTTFLATDSIKVTVVDPYDGQITTFANEQCAYDAFISQCGHSNYVANVKNAIGFTDEHVVLLGFSAGASAAWKAIDGNYPQSVVHFVGFYPSQIRHHLDVLPPCPVTLVFPYKEEHFDINKVINELSKLEMVFCIKTALLHGFMNSLSLNFAADVASVVNKEINHASKLTDITSLRRLLLQCFNDNKVLIAP